jgi:hypothetical protein
MNDIETILTDKETVDKLVAFFKRLHKMADDTNTPFPLNVVPCDDPLKGLKGFLLFGALPTVSVLEDDHVQEESIILSWRHAEEIKTITEVPSDQIDAAMPECFEAGWHVCNDPRQLRIGFVNYEKSECRYFKVIDARNASDDLKAKYREWLLTQCERGGCNG